MKKEEKNKSEGRTEIVFMPTNKVREFYRAEDLAEKLDVNIMTIYRYIKAGRLKAYKIGKEFRIDRKEFNDFLNKVSTK